MTETDNPEVKKHLELKDGQLLKRLEEIDDNKRDFQKMFESREIKPVVVVGEYNNNTGRYVLQGKPLASSSFTTATAASLTLTCATGHRYYVYYAAAKNATQTTATGVTASIGGNSVTINATNGLNTSAWQVVIGLVTAAAVQTTTAPIWLNAGDSITVTVATYGAGNDTEHLILYLDYTEA